MTRPSATPYIEWAKQKKGTWNLAVSGAPHATWADIGGPPADIPLTGDNLDGYQPLVDRIAARYGVEPSQVVTATGCSMANFLALAALIEPADEVLIEQPTYEPLLLAARHLGATVNRFDRLPSGAFEIDAGPVIAAMSPRTRVVVLSNLHNPSSQHVESSVLRAIGDAAARVGARVLVDEVYLDAVEDGNRTCVQLGPQFLATSSLTKVYGLAALRCGWVIADDRLARRIRRLNDLYENVRPLAPDWLATVAFDHLSALGSRTRALVHANRSVFVEWAAGRDDLTFMLPRWGTTLCVRPLRINAGRLCEELRAGYDVSVVPGRFFELPDHFRLALCTDSAVLREGLARLGQCLDTA